MLKFSTCSQLFDGVPESFRTCIRVDKFAPSACIERNPGGIALDEFGDLVKLIWRDVWIIVQEPLSGGPLVL